MSQPRPDSPPLDGFAQSATLLAGCLQQFIECWEQSEEPPVLREFLPLDGELRGPVLIELIKIDLEYRWLHRNLPKRIEEYAAELPELAEGGIPAELVYEEYHLRRQSGLRVEPQEYLERFPGQADDLRRLLGLDPDVSTAVCRPEGQRNVLDAIEAGQSLDEFDLLTGLGRGTFARVFLARQQSMQRLVALKVSADHGTEPQTLARLDHDGIVRVFDQRVLADSGLRLLYMQYIAGGTLQAVVQAVSQTPPAQRSGRLLFETVDRALEQRGEVRPAESAIRHRFASASWPEVVCWIGARLAAALDYAHRLGVLHRDVKPANVLLTAEGVPKLADFNISFAADTGVTPAAFFGGSLAYMSPEQLEAINPAHERQPDSLDGRSDLYSLGVMLFELLTGERPFRDESLHGGSLQALNRMTEQRRQGVSEAAWATLPADCLPCLVRMLRKCLAPDLDDRWASGAELARQCELCLQPEALDLLDPPDADWRRVLRPYAVPAVFIAAAVPNILAGVFNYHYNKRAVVPEDVQPVFEQVQFAINAIAYPVGLGLLGVLAWTVARGLRSLMRRDLPAGDAQWRLRRRCLHLGHLAAVIGVVEWTLAGVAYPASLAMASGPLSFEAVLHFFVSLVLCGLIAAAYPFFGATLYSVRVLYPALLQEHPPTEDDLPVLRRLRRLTGSYLALAALVPSLGVLALVVLRAEHGDVERFALQVLGLIGFLGFLLIYFCFFRPLQNDLEMLTELASPADV